MENTFYYLMKKVKKNHKKTDLIEWSNTIQFLEDITKLLDEVVIPEDAISYESFYIQQVLVKNISRIKDVNAGMGFIILDDDTIRCISSNDYIWQYDGCNVSELLYQPCNR